MDTNEPTISIREAADNLAAEYGHQVYEILAWMDVNPANVDIDDVTICFDAQGYTEMWDQYAADHARIEDEQA